MTKINLEQPYYFTQIIAVIALIITLIYLTLQVWASNQASMIDSFY